MDYCEFETENYGLQKDKYLVLIIYDISDNKRRLKLAKHLESYGTRVQKSAFEAWLTKKKISKLMDSLRKIVQTEDNVRIYKLKGYGEITVMGSQNFVNEEDVIII